MPCSRRTDFWLQSVAVIKGEMKLIDAPRRRSALYGAASGLLPPPRRRESRSDPHRM